MRADDAAASANIVIQRSFAADADRVFAAWTQPELLKRWFGPAEITIPNAKLDVRTGGTLSITMQTPGEEPWVVTGTYREVRPPNRLCYTCRVIDAADPGYDVMRLDLHQRAGATDLVLTHETAAAPRLQKRFRRGWLESFDKLARTLEESS